MMNWNNLSPEERQRVKDRRRGFTEPDPKFKPRSNRSRRARGKQRLRYNRLYAEDRLSNERG